MQQTDGKYIAHIADDRWYDRWVTDVVCVASDCINMVHLRCLLIL